MKRRAIHVVVFLLLGAIVNVAVAWTLAYGVNGWRTDALIFDLETALARTPTGRWQPIQVKPDGQVILTHSWGTEEPQAQRVDRLWHVLSMRPTHLSAEVCLQVGWPALALQAQAEGSACQLLGAGESLLTTPIWPGFAINTMVYAAILWMMFAFPGALRRRRRLRRGQCPACAYPIASGTGDVCSECGNAVNQS